MVRSRLSITIPKRLKPGEFRALGKTEGLELSGDEECLEIRYAKTGIQV